ncbi:DUF58 domain-containing protein [Pseudosulfitobacter sp. SM2401]|uniref:DUF58 domain-containing protein n=1 Tax=Pseudosulfitobacter sp. SM2401 TaxID=3350098 RepID=UPI0036F1B69F
MRPSVRLIALVLGVAAATVMIGMTRTDGATAVIALWGVLISVAIVDLAMSASARDFDISTDMQDTGYVGKSAFIKLSIRAKKNALPVNIALRLDHSVELSLQEDTVYLECDAGTKNAGVKIPIDLRERGEARLTRLSLMYVSRFGLFDVLPSWPLDISIAIVPDIAPVLNGEIHTQMLPLLDGLKDMNLRGEGSEFHQLREFQTGMDPRSIDWKRSARTRNLVARETRAERNHQIMLCLDQGHLMGERIGKLAKLDHAINASLSLAWAGGLGGDNVGFYSFDATPQTFIPPRPGRRAFAHIQKVSAGLEQVAHETNHTLGITQLNGNLKRRSLIVVFSDFVDSVTAELLVENLGVISRQHLVLYIALRDPELQAIAEPDDTSMNAIANSVSARQLLRERQAVLDRLQRLGILCIDTVPEQLTARLISRYIDIKSQEMI